MINLYGLLLGKASMLAQKLGSFLERRRRLFGGNWCGSLLPYPSKLSFYGLLCRIGSLQGVTKVMFKCLFCHNQTESREHLFFECSFSYRIWKFCMHCCRVDNPPVIWDEIMQ
jgi:hypothetical protein